MLRQPVAEGRVCRQIGWVLATQPLQFGLQAVVLSQEAVVLGPRRRLGIESIGCSGGVEWRHAAGTAETAPPPPRA